MTFNCSNRIVAAVVLLLLLTATLAGSGAAAAAVVVSLPTATLEADGVARAQDVGVTGGAGEAVVGYDLFFSVAPRPGAVGTLTLGGDWATAPASAAVFGTANPAQGGTYYAGYALASGSATLSPGAALNLLALRIAAAPGTLGTFDLIVGPGSTLYADDALNPVPGATFAGGAVTVTPAAAVPEPTSLALVALGALPLLRRRRRRC
jgi:hypothetical protein